MLHGVKINDKRILDNVERHDNSDHGYFNILFIQCMNISLWNSHCCLKHSQKCTVCRTSSSLTAVGFVECMYQVPQTTWMVITWTNEHFNASNQYYYNIQPNLAYTYDQGKYSQYFSFLEPVSLGWCGVMKLLVMGAWDEKNVHAKSRLVKIIYNWVVESF